jgi:hypothetical protein
MRIGNSYLPTLNGPDEPAGRRDTKAPKPADRSLQNTTDLIAMSSGVRFGSPLEAAEAARDIRVDQLAEAWRSGAYRPDPERVASKLMAWGFHPGAEIL